MRVIERQMIQAIIEKRNFKKANTEVIKDNDFMYIYLHNNLIAKYGLNDKWGQLFISHCDWRTNTTKSRLNALISFSLVDDGKITSSMNPLEAAL